MQLSFNDLKTHIQAADIRQVNAEQMSVFFTQELTSYLPDGVAQLDPRTELPVIFNEARARRPHDNDGTQPENNNEKGCIICSGNLTGIVDHTGLSEGSTFINKNLYPMVFPQSSGTPHPADALEIKGLHFLQWTSTHHEHDWHNMPLSDLLVVMQRLAVLEHWQLQNGAQILDSDEKNIYISIGKNYGRLVGGSLEHGHQQIALTNIRPRRVQSNLDFLQRRGQLFSHYMLQHNPAELTLRQYDSARLVVPYFMARPYYMMLLLENHACEYLHQLQDNELLDIAQGWQDAIRLMRSIMPQTGRELAYNIITHNGPGAGIYFEFLPYTQETGCFEHMGLYVCQNNPEKAHLTLKKELELYL